MARFRYRVLFLASWYPHQGHPYNGIFVKRKAEALKHRADVAVLFAVGVEGQCQKYRIEFNDDPGFPEWRVYYRRASPYYGPARHIVDRLRYLSACFRALARVRTEFGRPDLVHLHVIYPAGCVALGLKLLAGIPYVLTEHCDLAIRVSRGLQQLGPFSRFLMRLVARQASQVTVDSGAMRLAFKKQGWRNDAEVVWNIIDPPDCNRVGQTSEATFRLIHISSLWDRQKNISGLLRAVAKARKGTDGKKITLDIVGDGPERERLVNLACDLKLGEDAVRFHGRVDELDKRKLLCQSDCFVLSSRFEGFSVATAEALLAGLPVIVTDCGGPLDFVNRDNGLIVPVGDERALAEAMIWMSEHRGAYSRKHIAARARKDFDHRKVVDKILSIYDRVPLRWTAGLSWERIDVRPDWLVLDVGSGHNPNSRADVLLDRDLLPSLHRSGRRALVPEGRAMVVGDAVHMPFADGVFDFAIASHVAEHIEDVEGFLKELVRVARRGYLETPGPLTEYISNVSYHHWLVSLRGGRIVFERKISYIPPSYGLFAFFNLNDSIEGRVTYRSHSRWLGLSHRLLTRIWKKIPSAYVRLHWQGSIDFQVRH